MLTPVPTPDLVASATTGLSLIGALQGPREAALELAGKLPVPQILAEFKATHSGGRAEMLALLPVTRVPAVLLQDDRVFTVPISRLQQPGTPSQGFVTSVSVAEADRLRAARLGDWLVPTRFDDFGEKAIAWGLLRFVGQFSGADALERLDAVLDNDNDNAWKLGALQTMPEAYWALALLDTGPIDEEGPELRLGQIADISSDLETAIRTLMEGYSREELHMRVLEDREERLPKLQAEGAPVLSEASVKAMEGMSARRSAGDLLTLIRGGKP